MNIIQEPRELRVLTETWRDQGLSIAFVPTMGNIHAGHIQLVNKARQVADRIVVSIFVNPMQFAPNEDLARYPRTFAQDCAQLELEQVDIVFAPEVASMYPFGTRNHTIVEVASELVHTLCGISRAGHFVGVATVVTKLLNMVNAHYAIFGEKDYQQLLVVKRLVADLAINTEIISVATYREIDNLAMSSRNQYLTPAQRQLAPQLFASLEYVQQQLLAGIRQFNALEKQAQQKLQDHGFRIDYVEIRRANDLKQPCLGDKELIILAAVFLGQTRLIDNLRVDLT